MEATKIRRCGTYRQWNIILVVLLLSRACPILLQPYGL